MEIHTAPFQKPTHLEDLLVQLWSVVAHW